MSIGAVQTLRPAVAFWLLAVFLVLVFLTGGSSRADVESLQVLRPIAICVAAYGLFSTSFEHWRRYRHLAFVLAAVLLLTIGHLVPLSPETWRELPGRGIVQDIDALLGLRDQWRPFSMVPSGTWNALYALSVPLAVFSLAVQLETKDHIRLLFLVIALVMFSGTVGLLQAIGIHIQPYALSSENAGLFANRNHQGVLLAMSFPLLAVAAAFGNTLGLPPRLSVILASALAVVVVPLIIITGSRAGLIAAVLAALLVPMIGLGGAAAGRRNPWLAAARTGLAIGIVAVLVWMTIFASRETALLRLEGSEDDLRYPVWASIVDVLHIYMPWGSGIGSYADVYQILEPDALLRATFSNHAHNEWLEIALTAGLPGLAILAWVLGLFFYASWRAIRAPGVHGNFSRLGLGLILLLGFASTLDYPVRTPIMASVLLIAAVWASSFSRFGIEDARR